MKYLVTVHYGMATGLTTLCFVVEAEKAVEAISKVLQSDEMANLEEGGFLTEIGVREAANYRVIDELCHESLHGVKEQRKAQA